MINDLTSDQKKLAAFMSEISERCYFAGWMNNLEYVLWDVLESGQRTFGQGIITTEDIKQLKALSYKSESWICFHPEHEETALTLNAWRQKFKEDVKRNPLVLIG